MPNPMDALQEQMDAIGTAVTLLDGKMDKMAEDTQTIFKRIDEWIGRIEEQIPNLLGNIEEIKTRLNDHDKRFESIITRIDEIHNRLLEVETHVGAQQ